MNLLYFLCLALIIQATFVRELSENTLRKLDTITPNISASFEPLRIKFEYLTILDQETQQFLDQLFEIVGTFLQKHLLVRRSSQTISLTASDVEDYSSFNLTLTALQQSQTYDADLVNFVKVYSNSSDNTLAACGPVILDYQTGRPIFTRLYWNMGQTNLSGLTNAYYESQLVTAIHEIIHGLGFISTLFPYYYDSVTGQVYSNSSITTSDNIIMIQTPRVVAFAQKYFQCSEITGLPMEQEGGSGTAGSHWERALFYNEVMTGTSMVGFFELTDFTLQLLQDTGYYRLASYNPDLLTWGEGQGCDFFNKQCNGGTFKEFCTSPQGCSVGYTGYGHCDTDSLSNSCSYQQIYTNYDCVDSDTGGLSNSEDTFQYFGYNSMCIIGSLSLSNSTQDFSCYQYQCSSDNKLSIIVNGQTIDCQSANNQTLSGYSGSIQCPSDSVQYCKNVDECPNQCNKRGFCMKGLCTCIGTYYGVGCEIEGCTTVRNGKDCVNSCPTGYYTNTNINYCIGCPGNCKSCAAYNQCTECKDGFQLRGGFCDYVSFSNIINIGLYLLIIFGQFM